jgi:hypothetical protein
MIIQNSGWPGNIKVWSAKSAIGYRRQKAGNSSNSGVFSIITAQAAIRTLMRTSLDKTAGNVTVRNHFWWLRE